MYLLIIKFVRGRKHNDKKVHYEENFIYLSLNYKPTGTNITNYIVTLFTHENKIGIQCSLKTALYSVLINEVPGTVFSSLAC